MLRRAELVNVVREVILDHYPIDDEYLNTVGLKGISEEIVQRILNHVMEDKRTT